MSVHASFSTQIEVMGKVKTIQFRRGDLIYTLPDPAYLEENGDEDCSLTRIELSTEDLWIAQIADCCVLNTTSAATTSAEETSNLDILRVRWLYSQNHVLELNDQHTVLHAQYVNQVQKMAFEKHEVGEDCCSPVGRVYELILGVLQQPLLPTTEGLLGVN